MKDDTFFDYICARLGEVSTWQGIGFVLSLFGSRFGADVDWGQAAALGGIVSAGLKVAFPDKK